MERLKEIFSSNTVMIGSPTIGAGISLTTVNLIVAIFAALCGILLGVLSYLLKRKEKEMIKKTEEAQQETERLKQELLKKQIREVENENA